MNKIVISDKFKHSDNGFKYFTAHNEGDFVKPLCIILSQMSGYIKYFENGGKNMSLVIAYWINIIKFGTGLKRH